LLSASLSQSLSDCGGERVEESGDDEEEVTSSMVGGVLSPLLPDEEGGLTSRDTISIKSLNTSGG
jgi:hypothetical protein